MKLVITIHTETKHFHQIILNQELILFCGSWICQNKFSLRLSTAFRSITIMDSLWVKLSQSKHIYLFIFLLKSTGTCAFLTENKFEYEILLKFNIEADEGEAIPDSLRGKISIRINFNIRSANHVYYKLLYGNKVWRVM